MALATKIVFWEHGITGQLMQGLPENFPAPPYYNKIICGTAHEAETWSRKLREQEASRDAMVDEEREKIEGEMIRNLRSHMHSQIANARNNVNRDFLIYWLRKQDQMKSKTKSKRESYLHAEAYEKGR